MGILNLGGTTKRSSLSSQAVGREHLFCLLHLDFCDFRADFNLFAALAAMRAYSPQLSTKEHPLWLK